MRKDKRISIKKAVALAYREEYNAPKVIRKGKGKIADKLLEVSKDEGIEVYEDKELVEDLFKLDIDEEIPDELYEAISEIIAFIYFLDKKKGENHEE